MELNESNLTDIALVIDSLENFLRVTCNFLVIDDDVEKSPITRRYLQTDILQFRLKNIS